MINKTIGQNTEIRWPLNSIQRQVRNDFIHGIETGKYKLVEVKSCSGCESDNLEALAEVDRFGLSFRAEICQACGLIMTAPRLAEETIPRYYKEIYVPLVLGKQDITRLQVSPRQGELIYSFCRPTLSQLGMKILTVVEVGCASGHNLFQFSSLAKSDGIVCRLVGCEYSEYFKEYAERELGIHYTIGGGAELIEQGVKADVLILSHVFEHFTDIRRAKIQLQQLLTPGGLLYVEVPGILDLKRKFEYKCDFLLYRVHAHIHDFSLTTLWNALSPEFVLINGTEFCRAIFRATRRDDSPRQLVNDYNRIRLFLKELEVYRNKHRYWVQIRSLVYGILRKAQKLGSYLSRRRIKK